MSPLHDPSFMAHFAQCKVSAKQQVNSMIDAIYAKVLLDLELWLNKHQSNDSIKNKIESDCEENVTHHNNLPGESQFDQSTEAENDHLQNEVSLSNTINTEIIIKQEFDDDDGEQNDDENVAKCENCENGIYTTGDDAEMVENVDESSDATQLNQLIKQQCLQGSSITSISLDFTSNAALNSISIDEQIEGQNPQIQTDEFDYNDDDDDDYSEDGKEEYLNNPNCKDCANRVCDLDHESKNNHFNNDVSTEDEYETNFDEAQLQIDISITTNTQMNNQKDDEYDNNEKCVSERNMEQSTPSTSEARSPTRKRIQTKVFGDLVQSNANHRNSAKRKSAQANESGEKAKHQQMLDDDEDTDSDDNSDHTNNAILGESIATECTTNPIQPNRHLQCSYCHKSFDYPSALQRHLRLHTGERPFRCDQCDKRFSNRDNLASHQLTHQNMKGFQCDQCDKGFNHKVTLNKHLLVHSGERPHQCRFCDKSFAHWSTRNTHEQAIHLHAKPYRCKLCAHTTTHQSVIITHIRMVHFGLPRTIKQQRALNIIDERNPREFIEKV